MTAETQDRVRARAIEWHIRLRHGDDAVWEAFAEWLAEDPLHAEAYDEIEQADLAIDPLLPEVTFREAANDPEASHPSRAFPWRWWGLGGGALAASVAAAFVLLPHEDASSRYEIATAPGQHRTVALEPGTQVVLNGSTRILLDRKNPRFAALAAGEALFEVRHDDARPFSVQVGESRVEDLGTVFNVVRDGGTIRVAVAEGKVLYRAGKHAVPLRAGQALLDPAPSGPIRVSRAPAGSVGGWKQGRFVYIGEPMSQVAADLGRSLGLRLTTASDIAGRPFWGTIAIDDTGPDQLRRLAPALNVTFEAAGDGWIMKSAGAGG
jgi:transmembrane sensor